MNIEMNLMTVQDFAELMNKSIGMGAAKVYAMVKQPGFPSVRFGERYYILVDKVNDWIEQQNYRKETENHEK